MKPTARCLRIVAALLAGAELIGLAAPAVRAQDDAAAPAAPKRVFRAYDVGNLVSLVRNHPNRSATESPTKDADPQDATRWYSGSSRGIFEEEGKRPPPPRRLIVGEQAEPITMTELVEFVRAAIDPTSWDDPNKGGGGDAVIRPLGRLLVVSQTAANHERIEAALAAIAARCALPRLVTVEAQWVLLDAAAAAKLVGPAPPGGAAADAMRSIDPAALADAKPAVPYRAQITCFSGQTVHVFSGRATMVITDLIPMLSEQTATYRPIVQTVQWGPVLELTATLSDDGGAAVVEIDSMVNEPLGIRPKPAASLIRTDVKSVSPVETIDCLDFDAHKLRTTIKAPLGNLVVAGAMTAARSQASTLDAKPRDQADRVMYLLLRVTGEPPAGRPKPAP